MKLEIYNEIEEGYEVDNIYEKIKKLADKYMTELNLKVNTRIEEMKQDDNSHYLIYKVLGIKTDEGQLIDEYQNKGRFLYKYAGSFLEEAGVDLLKILEKIACEREKEYGIK